VHRRSISACLLDGYRYCAFVTTSTPLARRLLHRLDDLVARLAEVGDQARLRQHRVAGNPRRDFMNAPAEPRYGRVMRIAFALVAACLVAVGGSMGALAAAPSGIRGTVIKSPTKPVCEEDVPCSAPAAGVVLVLVRNGVEAARARTQPNGSFRVVLSPGTYVVRTLRKFPIGGMHPRTVRVLAGRFTVANFEIDTGIR
jgi:hypothetical protein